MDEHDIEKLLEDPTAVRSKRNVVAALDEALKAGKRITGIKHFVDYYFAHEKKHNQPTISIQALAEIYAKCEEALQQPVMVQEPRVKKRHSSKDLKPETVIHASENVHGNVVGSKGWIPGWLTTHPSNATVDLKLKSSMFVTKIMVHAVNVKASPKAMELYAKDEKTDEWVLVRGFNFRRRDYDGTHGKQDYSKKEMFYVLGNTSNQSFDDQEDWQKHPLAGLGKCTSNTPDLYMASRFWRWRIIDSNGAGYVGINDFHLYGRPIGLPPPEDVQAEVTVTGAKLTWTPIEDNRIYRFHIIAYPGGLGHYSNGGFYEWCSGHDAGCIFSRLSPGVMYQFQVITVDHDGNNGMPSAATAPITMPVKSTGWLKQFGGDSFLQELDFETEATIEDYTALDGMEYESIAIPEQETEFEDAGAAFKSMIGGNFSVVDQVANTNKVTLYVSGCLEDTNVERKYITKYAIPKLELWCNSKGYDFSGTDLRWGLASEVINDHKTFAIHMQELEKAYADSSLTIFYFISGERYGSVLLPSVISEFDRDAIRAELKPSMKWIIDMCYHLDQNGDPPVYKLRNISEIENSNKHKFWDGTTVRGVHSLLKEIMNVMMKSEKVSDELKKWEPSLAMAECFYALDATKKSSKNKFLCSKRTLENLYQAMESERDFPPEKQKAKEMGCVDVVERRRVHKLREILEADPSVFIYKYSFDWKKDGIDISREDLTMKRLCARLFSDVKKVIQKEIESRKAMNDDEQEMVHHVSFVKGRSASFIGREALLRSIMANIAATNGKITVIHGVSGAGKTSVMCSVASRTKIFLPENAVTMIRLCGTSPQSSSAKGIMRSLCMQLHKYMDKDDVIPDAFDTLVEYFHSLLETAVAIMPVAIFIDSLDQLTDEDAGRSQPWKWIPRELPENLYFIASTLPDAQYGILEELMSIYPRSVEVPLVPSSESVAILTEWMQQSKRTLTAPQKMTVQRCLSELADGISMLHLRLICDRVTKWTSEYEPLPLPLTVQGMIERVFHELENDHGKRLVSGFLSLLCASKDGLNSENIADILSADEDALGGRGEAGTILENHDPPIRRVPPFLVAQLKHDLGDYLVERGANQMKVLGLYHRQFIETANRIYLEPEENRMKAYTQLIEYFNGESANKFIERGISAQPFWFFIDGDDRVPNRQKLVELPHAVVSSGQFEEQADLIMSFDYIEAKCTAGGDYASSLMEDYVVCIENLPRGQKQDAVCAFYRFISTWFHVLRRNATCLTTLALNYVPDNIVTRRMKEKWDSKLGCEVGGWTKWMNAPGGIDPCVFTNVVSKTDCITSIRCTPDASLCAVAGKKFCGLYDFRSYQLQCDFRGHTSWIRAVCFSPDGHYALSVSNDLTGRVWNTINAEQCSILSGHLSWVMDCDWSPKDNMVLTVSDDGSARIWNPYLGDLIGLQEHHGASVRCGCFSYSGLEVVTGDIEGKIMRWNAMTCVVDDTIHLKSAINCLQWSEAAGAIAAATYSGLVVLLDYHLEIKMTFEGFEFSVNHCVFSPDGKELFAAGAEHVGRVFKVEDGHLIGRCVGHSEQITAVDWMQTERGNYLLTGSEDQTVKQWDRRDIVPGDVFESFAIGSWKPEGAFAIAFTKEGDLYGIDNEMHLFRCMDALGGNSKAPFLQHYGKAKHKGDKTGSALSPDGETWAICTYAHSSEIISSQSGQTLKSYSLKDVAHNKLVWDPLGSARFFASGHGKHAVIWDAKSEEVDTRFDINTWVWDASWSRDGHAIAVSCDSGTHVYDMRPESALQGLKEGENDEGVKEDETGEGIKEGETGEDEGERILKAVYSTEQSKYCALNSDGTLMGIVSKIGQGYNSSPSAGYLYRLNNLRKADKIFTLEGRFNHASKMMFSSNDKFLLVSFNNIAFGSSPSICAYDAEFALPIAFFASPLNNNFVNMTVPQTPSNMFVAVDGTGRIFIFNIEEA